MKKHNVIKKKLVKNTVSYESNDWENAKLIWGYIKTLKETNEYTTLSNIANKLGITSRELRIYMSWVRTGEILGEIIDKSKADVLNTFITGEEIEEMKRFWSLNKNLSTRELKAAKKIYIESNEIINYREMLNGACAWKLKLK